MVLQLVMSALGIVNLFFSLNQKINALVLLISHRYKTC